MSGAEKERWLNPRQARGKNGALKTADWGAPAIEASVRSPLVLQVVLGLDAKRICIGVFDVAGGDGQATGTREG